jgi:hypothetical protein
MPVSGSFAVAEYDYHIEGYGNLALRRKLTEASVGGSARTERPLLLATDFYFTSH